MSNIYQELIDAYYPRLQVVDKYQALIHMNNMIVKDNTLLKDKIKSYQYNIGVACVLCFYAGLIYYIEK